MGPQYSGQPGLYIFEISRGNLSPNAIQSRIILSPSSPTPYLHWYLRSRPPWNLLFYHYHKLCQFLQCVSHNSLQLLKGLQFSHQSQMHAFSILDHSTLCENSNPCRLHDDGWVARLRYATYFSSSSRWCISGCLDHNRQFVEFPLHHVSGMARCSPVVSQSENRSQSPETSKKNNSARFRNRCLLREYSNSASLLLKTQNHRHDGGLRWSRLNDHRLHGPGRSLTILRSASRTVECCDACSQLHENLPHLHANLLLRLLHAFGCRSGRPYGLWDLADSNISSLCDALAHHYLPGVYLCDNWLEESSRGSLR